MVEIYERKVMFPDFAYAILVIGAVDHNAQSGGELDTIHIFYEFKY